MPTRTCLQMLSIALLCLFAVNCPAQETAPTDSLQQLLTAKENEMFDVIVNGKKEAAQHLLADDYITINADGVMEGKQATIQTLGKFKGSTATLSDKHMRVYGNTAIINGRAKFYVKSLLVAEIFYTEIWHNSNQQWLFTGWQGTMTGTPSYYSVIFTIIVLLLLMLVIRFIRRRRKRIKK